MLSMARFCLLKPCSKRRCALQVETPVLETSAGGADARPFTTFHNALQQPYALRIATGKSDRSAAPANIIEGPVKCKDIHLEAYVGITVFSRSIPRI